MTFVKATQVIRENGHNVAVCDLHAEQQNQTTICQEAQLCPNCGHKQDNPPAMNCEDCSWPLQAPAQAQHSPLPWKLIDGLIHDASGKKTDSNADRVFAIRACNNAQRLADELSLIVRTVNDTLRHGLTVGQEEALTDCARSSGKALEDFRKQESITDTN